MQNKASDKSSKATELDDNTLDGVVGGMIGPSGTMGIRPSGSVSGPLPTGGGGAGDSSKPSPDGGLGTGTTSGSLEPNSIHFPK